jgi:hypothetical protein
MRTDVQIFKFKAGLLARLAHDLRLRVTAFEITLRDRQVDAWFDATSLQVEGVAHGEQVDSDGLSAQDKQKIQQTIRDEILDSRRFPRVELTGTLNLTRRPTVIDAKLRLCGVEHPIEVPVEFQAGKLSAQASFAPSAFGIVPYKALAGAIRLQDRVVVRVATLTNCDSLEAFVSAPEARTFSPV